ncbi:MAG: hypothetical protein R3D83_03085 [Caenibius sp.]
MSEHYSRRKLPTISYVSLSEALTWIAFGDAMRPDKLREQVEGHQPPVTDSPEERVRKFFAGTNDDAPAVQGLGYFHDRQSALDRLTEAWRQLREEVERGAVKVRGRFTPTYSLADARLADVSDLTGALLATSSQFDVSTGGLRRQPEGSPDIMWQGDPRSFDREYDSFGDDARATGGYLLVEVERDGVLRSWPNPVNLPRKSFDEVINWCTDWISSGRGNGMDRAWESFSAAPEHVGLSRDYVFRPAWRKAKTR